MWRFLALLATLSVVRTNAQFVHDGQCDVTKQTVEDLDMEKFLGTWYEVKRYSIPFQRGEKCPQTEFTKDKELTAVNTVIRKGKNRIQSRGNLEMAMELVNGKILATDYVNYAIIWNCKNLDKEECSEVAWIFSRTPALNPTVLPTVTAFVEKNLNKTKFKLAIQDIDTCGY